MIDLQRDAITDPIIRESLFEIPGKDHFVLSAAALFHSAAAFFNKDPTDDGSTRLVEHFPALTLKRREKGPNGEQTYEVWAILSLNHNVVMNHFCITLRTSSCNKRSLYMFSLLRMGECYLN